MGARAPPTPHGGKHTAVESLSTVARTAVEPKRQAAVAAVAEAAAAEVRLAAAVALGERRASPLPNMVMAVPPAAWARSGEDEESKGGA